MFLRSKRVGPHLYWQVVETYRDKPAWSGERSDRIRHRTVYSLGRHETRASAQAAWDEAVARGDSRVSLQIRKAERRVSPEQAVANRTLMEAFARAFGVVSEPGADDARL